MSIRAVTIVSLFLALSSTTAADDKKDDSKKDMANAEKLVGTWKMVANSQGTPEGVTFFVEFTKDGKMILRIVPKDKDQETTTLKGTYTLAKDKIDYKMDDGSGGTKQEMLTIKKLTNDELVVLDPDEVKEEFKRVKEEKVNKKKDEK